MNITLAQKRFLIIWCCIHTFALIVNLVPIKGETVDIEPKTFYHDPFPGNYSTVSIVNYKTYSYIFTDGHNNGGFWPFVNQSEHYLYAATSFRGIFAEYDISEYITYILLGFAIVFIPKLWSKNESTP